MPQSRRGGGRARAAARAIGVAAVGTLTLCGPAAASEPLQLFDEAAALVEAQFYDPAMNGLDWAAVTATHRARITPETDREGLALEFNRMLSRLDASHTVLVTRDDPTWFELAGIFIDGYPPLREALESSLGHADPVYTGIGVMLERRPSGHFVTGVLHGFPAAAAGILAGDRLVSAEDEPYHPIRSFAGRAGLPTRVRVERQPGELRDLTVTPVLMDGRTQFAQAMRASAAVLPTAGFDIGYLRAWSYAGQAYQDILVEALTSGALADADALVLDLRGGWGGASPSHLNYFADAGIEVDSIGRDGASQRFASGWTRPVVLLIDGGTRSGKELLAFGFRALGKGPTVGETTAGAALIGRINALSDGSLLYVAVADVRVDGERLEGQGVTPDVVVPFDPAFAAGADPQLERAREVAAEQVRRARENAGHG